MTKDQIKTGMVIEYRNGEQRLVMNNLFVSFPNKYNVCMHSHRNLFNDQLCNISNPNYDIVKVYEPRSVVAYQILNHASWPKILKCIWTRGEVKPSKPFIPTDIRGL